MSDKENLFFKGADKSKRLVKSAWEGSRMVATVVVGGLALGLGLRAFGSVSSN